MAHHTKDGWDYDKVNAVITHIDSIFHRVNLTFVEESVVLQWFQCQLIYKLGKHSAKDFLNEVFPDKSEEEPIRGEMYH